MCPQTQPATLGNLGYALLEDNATGQATRVNQNLIINDILIQGSVKDKDLTAPPGSPAEADRYIIAASPTGAWAGKAKYITGYYNSAWVFIAPKNGMIVRVVDESKNYQYDGSAWVELTATVTTAPTRTTVTKTASFTASTSEAAIYRIDASGGSVVVTLPAAASAANRGWIFKRIDTSINTVTLDPNSTELIEGALTYSLVMQGDSVDINSNGTDWDIV